MSVQGIRRGHTLATCFSVILFLLKLLAMAYADQSSPPSFSQDNIIVRFSPYVAEDDSSFSYDEPDIVPMIEKISTKFSKILAPRIDVKNAEEENSLVFVANAIATHNKNQLSEISGNSDKMSHPGIVQAFLMFHDSDSELAYENSNITSFEAVMNYANKANSIFPRTVEYLLVEEINLQVSNSQNVQRQLTKALHKISRNPIPYKLGAVFPLSACGTGANLRNFLAPLLRRVRLVAFHIDPEQGDFEAGVQETVAGYMKQFKRCQGKIAKLNLSLEVAFRSSWADTDFNGKQNFSNLVLFWKEMNGWAKATNTKVFLLEAFDTPFRKGNEKNQGWWRLTSKKSYHGSADYVYEDKFTAAIRERKATTSKAKPEDGTTSHPDPHGSNKGLGVLNIVLITVLASAPLLVVTVIGMILMHRKMLLRMDNRDRNLLSKEEIQEFFDGAREKEVPSRGSLLMGGDVNSLHVVAYNKEYELAPEAFIVDSISPLGEGAFGLVCKGKVYRKSEEVAVAVKMAKKSCPASALKGLLSEIKVLSFLGEHENVVCLVGAYTDELKRGKVYVFTELCSLGSLEKHLRKIKPRYSRPPRPASNMEPERNYLELLEVNSFNERTRHSGFGDGHIHSDDMRRWSFEIACGMEFLTSKNVVHADLATRNVLLTENKRAKISDFGLSRRLYDYTNYVKTEQSPLPWRWMPPEALRRLEFNEKTDVWSFGVTLWEIYSMGDLPYPGLSWNMNFTGMLLNGLRLEEPQYNKDCMYTVMLKCWNNDPGKRPSFLELKEKLCSV